MKPAYHVAKQFKTICTLEGISALALFFFAMPMKYIFHQEIYVQKIGMLHGVLFVAYLIWALLTWRKLKWTLKDFIIICACSIPPGATFWVEKKYLKAY